MSEWGTFNVCRGLFGHPVFAAEPFTEREAWIWLIGTAAYRAHERRIGRARVKLERGQLAHAMRFLAQNWRWSESKVRRFLHRLAAENMVTLKSDELATLITICNYDTYQADVDKSDELATNSRRRLEEGKKEDIGGGGAISPEAFALARDFLLAIGIDPQNPELYGMAGAPYAAAVWIARGYDRDLVLATASDVAARHGAQKPLNYYTKCFETAHRKRAEIPQPQMPLLRTIEGGGHEAIRRDFRGGRGEGGFGYSGLAAKLRARETG